MTKPNLLELPSGVQLVYLAEGGANVIYRFVRKPVLARKDPKRPLPHLHTTRIIATYQPNLRGNCSDSAKKPQLTSLTQRLSETSTLSSDRYSTPKN
jgi:hypothetical protein